MDLIEKLSVSSDKVIRNKLYIFLICLGIAVFIWLMIKLSGEYNSNITYPFRFTGIPSGKLLVENSDTTLNIAVKSNGLRLFSTKYLNTHPVLNVDLRKVKIHRSRYKYGSYVLSSSFKNNIISQLENNNKIVSILPDTLFLIMEDKRKKRVPVKTNIKLDFKKQFQQYGDIQVKPDSILLSGLSSIIDTINSIKVSDVELNDLYKDVILDIQIIKPVNSKNISYSTETVKVKIPVENYTESSIEIPIKQVGDYLKKVKTFPNSLKITYTVALRDFDRVDKSLFTAGVDCSDLSVQSKILKVNLYKYPNFVDITGMDPENVEYLILK